MVMVQKKCEYGEEGDGTLERRVTIPDRTTQYNIDGGNDGNNDDDRDD